MTQSQKILLLWCSAAGINQNYNFNQRGSLDQNTSSIKTIPEIPKECDRKICTCLMIHNRRPQLSAETRCSSGKRMTGTYSYIYLCLQLSTSKDKVGQRSGWVFSYPGSEVFLTAEEESLFSLKTSIKIDLHRKDNFFTLLFQLKYYLVSAEVLIFELSIFFLLNCKEVTWYQTTVAGDRRKQSR